MSKSTIFFIKSQNASHPKQLFEESEKTVRLCMPLPRMSCDPRKTTDLRERISVKQITCIL
ncbi:hypothetical protein V1478_001973 [Vespula squamosa]|uniref:Uncharacterized protein n=1 Tax=Vespula squamosa TaxID=30214 RepID=A0ABD2BYN7_VESSQ